MNIKGIVITSITTAAIIILIFSLIYRPYNRNSIPLEQEETDMLRGEAVSQLIQQISKLSEEELISLLAPMYNNISILKYKQKISNWSDEEIISQFFHFELDKCTEVELALDIDFWRNSISFAAYFKVPVDELDEFIAYEKSISPEITTVSDNIAFSLSVSRSESKDEWDYHLTNYSGVQKSVIEDGFFDTIYESRYHDILVKKPQDGIVEVVATVSHVSW